jgi:hypothetical protein
MVGISILFLLAESNIIFILRTFLLLKYDEIMTFDTKTSVEFFFSTLFIDARLLCNLILSIKTTKRGELCNAINSNTAGKVECTER